MTRLTYLYNVPHNVPKRIKKVRKNGSGVGVCGSPEKQGTKKLGHICVEIYIKYRHAPPPTALFFFS